MKKSIYLIGLLLALISTTSCNNFIENTKNQYSYTTLATLVPSNEPKGEVFIADVLGFKLIATNYTKPDTVPYNSRFMLAFSVWDYDMNDADSTWTITLNASMKVDKKDMYIVCDTLPEPAMSEQQLYDFELYSLYKEYLTLGYYTFKPKGEGQQQMELVRDVRNDSIGSDGKYYVSLQLKHYAPGINAHNFDYNLVSYDISPLQEEYKSKTDTLMLNFTYTVDKPKTLTLKYALR